jgi:hypothetical protein
VDFTARGRADGHLGAPEGGDQSAGHRCRRRPAPRGPAEGSLIYWPATATARRSLNRSKPAPAAAGRVPCPPIMASSS